MYVGMRMAMNGGRSAGPLGLNLATTTAGHVPFEDLLYRGLEDGLLVAPPPPPRPRTGRRCNMFLRAFFAAFAIISAAVIIWAAISPRSPEHLDPYQMTALLVFELTMSAFGYLLALDADETI